MRFFFYTSKTAFGARSASVESLEKGPSCSCETHLGARGDLCSLTPCCAGGGALSRPWAALDRRAREEEGVGPLCEWLVQLLGSAVWNEREKDPKKSLGSSQKFC